MIYNGTLLSWAETKKLSNYFRQHGIEQFINLYLRYKDRDGDPFKWGDEMEYILVKFDDINKTARLSLRAKQLLEILNEKENENPTGALALWSPEYANYMIEACPSEAYDGILSCIKLVETNMRNRRKEVLSLLPHDEIIMSCTNFPRMGASNFTYPIYKPQPENENSIERSIYFPDEAVSPCTLMTGTVSNLRQRRGKNLIANAIVFKDKNTEIPVDGSPSNIPDAVHLDAMGFGFGCCSLQTTIQASNLNEVRILYDQMAPLCPIMLTLTASTPAFRGYLVETDCRWNILSQATDCRTDGERGDSPLKDNEYRIFKYRFDSIAGYISPNGAKYNDVTLQYNEESYEKIRDAGVDHLFAQYIAQSFFRDIPVLFKELLNQNDKLDIDLHELNQKMNWPTIKLKQPTGPDVGWRIEFRPCELQLTDFDNAAIACFNILLTRIILAYNLNFLIPISKIDENMQIAQKRNACNVERFWFRKNIFDKHINDSNVDDEFELMTMQQIFNGNGTSFPGLIPLIKRYLSSQEIDAEANSISQRYLRLIQQRASGEVMTPASWIRYEVTNHPDYKNDSIISERINYDLMKKVHEIQEGKRVCTELHGTSEL